MGSNAGGFDFALTKRNQMLELKGMAPPKAWKTGTTIAGVMFKVRFFTASTVKHVINVYEIYVQGGVVLGADTRSTSGSTVADKNCEKIHFIADNIYCCGAGTAADTENVTSQWGFPIAQITMNVLMAHHMHATHHPASGTARTGAVLGAIYPMCCFCASAVLPLRHGISRTRAAPLRDGQAVARHHSPHNAQATPIQVRHSGS